MQESHQQEIIQPAFDVGQREVHTESEEPKDKKGAIATNFDKGFKYNGLPKLEKRGVSKPRTVHTTQPGRDLAEENTTTHMSVHSRATLKIPIVDSMPKKNQLGNRNPHRSLPRINGGPRKLDKMLKSKVPGPDIDQNTDKETKISLAKGETASASKSTVVLKQFSKSTAGYSDGKTKTNQDTMFVNLNIKQSLNCALFGVFDGHGLQGHKVSQHLKANILGIIRITRIFRIAFRP